MDYKPLPLPTLTHLQALVCWSLHSPYWQKLTTRDLLALLKRHGVKMSESAFYQLMKRMESAGYVSSEAGWEAFQGRRMASRRYSLTREGLREWQKTLDFYQAHQDHPKRFFCTDYGVQLLPDDDWNGDRAIKAQ